MHTKNSNSNTVFSCIWHMGISGSLYQMVATFPMFFPMVPWLCSAPQFFRRSLRPPRRLALTVLLQMLRTSQRSLLWGSSPSSGEQRSSCHPAPRKTKCSFREEEALPLSLVRLVEFRVFAKGKRECQAQGRGTGVEVQRKSLVSNKVPLAKLQVELS